jgi:Tfp pilus assembly protein PilP
MRKLFALIMLGASLFVFSGCGGNSTEDDLEDAAEEVQDEAEKAAKEAEKTLDDAFDGN